MISAFLWLISMMLFTMWIIIPVVKYYGNMGWNFPGGNFWLLLFVMIAGWGGVFCTIQFLRLLESIFITPIIVKLSETISNIIDLHKEIAIDIQSIENIEIILEKTGEIQLLQNKLHKIRFFISILTPRNSHEFSIITNESLIWCIDMIMNLRSDLATRLTEQQQILEWVKSEVEQNITGTPELIAVSELQRTRLDRQIEQFEELQRVLVRV